jgi:hypothetical protein
MQFEYNCVPVDQLESAGRGFRGAVSTGLNNLQVISATGIPEIQYIIHTLPVACKTEPRLGSSGLGESRIAHCTAHLRSKLLAV